jgi:hypothetical protein
MAAGTGQRVGELAVLPDALDYAACRCINRPSRPF